MPPRTREFNLCGFPVAVSAPWSERAFRALLGDAARRPRSSQGAPALRVRMTEDAREVWLGSARERLAGEDFALDCSARLLLYRMRAARIARSGRRGQVRQDWSAMVLFALSLLTEHHGPEALCGAATRRQVPLCLHSSSVATPRGALVFCGFSTFGKSTLAGKLLGGYPLIEDDLTTLLVSPAKGGRSRARPRVFMKERYARLAFGKPDDGSPAPWALPLRGLFWLKKGPLFALERMDAGEAATVLFAPILGHPRPETARHRLKLLHALLQDASCWRLEFRKERQGLRELLKEADFI